MKGHPIKYSAAEMAWLEENRLKVISDYHRAFVEAFGRGDVSAVNLHSLRKRNGWKTGRTGCFEKGAEPHNKGVPCPPGKGGHHPNARKTQFRKGNRTGQANRNYKPVGTERLSEDGYREIKVHDGLPRQSRWQLVHRVEWEKANGPVLANVMLDGILSENLVAPKTVEPGVSTASRKECLPVRGRVYGGDGATPVPGVSVQLRTPK